MSVLFELRRLSPEDGMDIYEMLQEIGADENGFMNGAYGLSPAEFRDWLKRQDDMSNGTGLEDWMVPQTTYWLYADGVPVGFGKLRHRLTDRLREEGGHIGYAIRKSARGKGYAKEQLALVVEAARAMGITEPLLVTVNEDNAPSIRTAMACSGRACKSRLEKVQNGRHYIWIE